jgi:hypothetical protein
VFCWNQKFKQISFRDWGSHVHGQCDWGFSDGLKGWADSGGSSRIGGWLDDEDDVRAKAAEECADLPADPSAVMSRHDCLGISRYISKTV